MPLWIRAAGGVGSILLLIALLITLIKQLIALVGFIAVALKILVVVAFIAVICGVGFLILKGLNDKKKAKN